MTDELRAFRSELTAPPPRAEARARSRLEALIASEAAAPRRRSRARGRAAAYALAGALLGSGALTATTAVVLDALGSPGSSRLEAEGGATDRRVWHFRSGQPDGLLAALPSLEGKDAGTRPTSDRGGWSECGTSQCYLQS